MYIDIKTKQLEAICIVNLYTFLENEDVLEIKLYLIEEECLGPMKINSDHTHI